MPRSNRRGQHAALGLTLVVALLLGLAAAWSLGVLQGSETVRRDQTPAIYRDAAKVEAQRSCAAQDASNVFDCVYERAETSREIAHEEQDLSAQQRAAGAALATTILGLATMIATLVGLWFIRGTLLASRRTVTEARKATLQARRGNAIARDTAQRQLRPYLSVSPPKILSIAPNMISLRIVLRNHGETPARVESVFGRAWGGPSHQIDPHAVGTPMRGYAHFAKILARDAPCEIELWLENPAQIAFANGGGGRLYVYGKVDYEDGFGNSYWLTWAYRSDPSALTVQASYTSPFGNDGTSAANRRPPRSPFQWHRELGATTPKNDS